MDNAKIYGLCLERLKHQIRNARRFRKEARVLIEGYLTGDIEEIIDLLELYDIELRTDEALTEKLDELAFTASVLLRETLTFGYDGRGHLGLYVMLPEAVSSPSVRELETVAA